MELKLAHDIDRKKKKNGEKMASHIRTATKLGGGDPLHEGCNRSGMETHAWLDHGLIVGIKLPVQ
jgi:hypothetical protein